MSYKKVKQFIDDFLTENQLTEASEKINQNLSYYLDYESSPIEDESKVPLGTSKIYGLPHLPDSIDFPQNERFFIAQLNCAEIKPYDIYNRLPEKGILYFFIDETGTETDCFFYDGPTNQLKVTNYPEAKNPYYTQKDQDYFINQSKSISFEGKGRAIMRRGRWEKVLGDHSVIFMEELEQAFGDEITIWNISEEYKLPDNFLFGSPLFWQGERKGKNREMLHCISFAGGNINYFIKNGKLDPKEDICKQITGKYSG